MTISWWRHQMETFSALLAISAGNSPVPGEFPAQRPVTRSFDVFFDLRLNKRLSKQSRGWWFDTLSCLLWRHRNVCGGDRGSGPPTSVQLPTPAHFSSLPPTPFFHYFFFGYPHPKLRFLPLCLSWHILWQNMLTFNVYWTKCVAIYKYVKY